MIVWAALLAAPWVTGLLLGALAGRGVRAVEGARLESVCTPKAYRGFESLPLRHPYTQCLIFPIVRRLPRCVMGRPGRSRARDPGAAHDPAASLPDACCRPVVGRALIGGRMAGFWCTTDRSAVGRGWPAITGRRVDIAGRMIGVRARWPAPLLSSCLYNGGSASQIRHDCRARSTMIRGSCHRVGQAVIVDRGLKPVVCQGRL